MKGFWYMIEAVMAGIILVSFVSFLAVQNFAAPEEDLTERAYKTLEGLDSQGLLKGDAVARNHTNINSRVSIFAYSHAVEICSLNSCSGERPSGKNVWVGSYIVPGQARYDPVEVRLYIYR